MEKITNEQLHVLFHDLSNAICGIDMTSQICVTYITGFNMERLEGTLKENMQASFKNIPSYRSSVAEKLALVVDALNKIDTADIAVMLESDIDNELKEMKKIEDEAGMLYSRLLEFNAKENLLRFAAELKKFVPVCRVIIDVVNKSKVKLTALGKY